MEIIKGKKPARELSLNDIKLGAELEFGCCVHKIKKRSTFTFVTLRTGRYTLLAVHNPKYCEKPLKGVFEGVYLKVKCTVREEKRAENGLEIAITDYCILSKPKEKYSMPVSDRVLDCAPEEIAENRAVSLRHPMERASVRVLGVVMDAFSDFMKKSGFLRVRTPKITGLSTEPEKDLFTLDYFGNQAFLSTDPSFYCQGSLAYFDRVYDISDVFFGKKRNSPRLLSEYTVLHCEMAYIKDMWELMELETAIIKYIIGAVKRECEYEIRLLEAKLPEISNVPVISFDEAMKLLNKTESQPDLDPTDEKRISAWAKKSYESEFVFVTGLPSEKRPVYYKENENFVLLFRGMEIASGGEKITDYTKQAALAENYNIKPYLDFHKYGMPPHGGVGTGLERFVMQLLGLRDIRQTALFPRDIHILAP